jgi:hypothetical protein
MKAGTASRWIDGYDRNGKHDEPVIRESTLGNDVATRGEFVEARMLAEYRNAGVKIIRMRPALEVLRRETRKPPHLAHPPLRTGMPWSTDLGAEVQPVRLLGRIPGDQGGRPHGSR